MRIIERGSGAPVLLIHGSAADAMTWSFQLAAIKRGLRMIAYDRRAGVSRIADHVADAIAILDQHGVDRATACGSSFGGLIALELARHHPDRIRAALVCEPPVSCSDSAPSIPAAFGCAFDRIVATQSGAAAGEFFLRTVLGNATYDDLPASFRARAGALWPHIRDDALALARYRVGYDDLAVEVPVSLITGERSPAWYRDTIDALAAALGVDPIAVPGAGHMMHAEAPRWFNDHLLAVAGAAAAG